MQPCLDTATGQIAGSIRRYGRDAHAPLHSDSPLLADPKTPPTALCRLDRQERGRANLSPPDTYCRLLRVFWCDRHGSQPPPNLQWRQGAWRADSRYLSPNWSWRPCVYQLLAEGWGKRRSTLCSTYRDATSNPYCLTAGQFTGNGRRLQLVDSDAGGL